MYREGVWITGIRDGRTARMMVVGEKRDEMCSKSESFEYNEKNSEVHGPSVVELLNL